MTFLTLSYLLCIIFIPSPIALNIRIIILAIIVRLNISIISFSWFSFITFLLYVGGILVIFIYFSSLTPNQKFPLTLPLILILLSSPLFSLVFKNNNFILRNNLKVESSLLYSEFNIPISLFFIIFLFVILLVVVKLSSNFKLPMRPINYIIKCNCTRIFGILRANFILLL